LGKRHDVSSPVKSWVLKLDLTDNDISNGESSNDLYQQLAELPLVHPGLVKLTVAGAEEHASAPFD